MSDYSQSGEQCIIIDFFKGRAAGVFIDVGAGDGVRFSNTRALFEAGWDGVLIEPDAVCFAALAHTYGRDTVSRAILVNAALTLDKLAGEPSRMHFGAGNLFTTTSDAEAEWRGLDKFRDVIVGTITCARLFSLASTITRQVDFINVDVEGDHEWRLSRELARLFKPALMCLETRGGEPLPPGYRCIANTPGGPNSILARADLWSAQ